MGFLVKKDERSGITVRLSYRRGISSVVPWCYSVTAGVACACLVAWYSVNWSEAKTIGWLECTALSLVWKLFVFDPLKASHRLQSHFCLQACIFSRESLRIYGAVYT